MRGFVVYLNNEKTMCSSEESVDFRPHLTTNHDNTTELNS